MKLLKYIALCGGVALLPLNAHAAIPGTTAAATAYEMTVTQVELCRSAACANPHILGSGSKLFDIAAATAGADVGSYVSADGIPLFQTWTHVRVTISTTITIAGAGTDNGAQACRTVNGQASGSHVNVGTGTVGAGAGTAQSLVM